MSSFIYFFLQYYYVTPPPPPPHHPLSTSLYSYPHVHLCFFLSSSFLLMSFLLQVQQGWQEATTEPVHSQNGMQAHKPPPSPRPVSILKVKDSFVK